MKTRFTFFLVFCFLGFQAISDITPVEIIANNSDQEESASVSCKTPPLFDALIIWPSYTPGTWITDIQRSIFAGECFVYKVDLVVGKEYTFKTGCGNGAAANFDTFIEVWDSTGTGGITSNDDGCESWTSSVSWTATETVAYVVVKGFDASKFGDFILSCKYDDPAPVNCKTPPLFDANITWPGYTPGTWINDSPRTIGIGSCFVYKVDLVVGKEYTFKVGCGDGATANFDTFIEVWDSAGTGGITNNDDACEDWTSSVSWTATQSVAYVVVRGFNSEKYGTYTLACKYSDPAPSSCLTPPLSDLEITWPGYVPGTWINDAPRSVASGACFVYKVNLVLGKEYIFKVGCGNGATADFDTFIEVWDSAGVSGITNNDDACEAWTSSVTWTATQTVAFVVVKGFNASKFGTYTLACKYDDPAPSSCLIPPLFDYNVGWGGGYVPGTWITDIQRTIGSGACVVYKTDLVAGKEYTFKVGCGDGASANFDSFIEVWDSAGVNGITNNDDACEAWTSSVTWIATQSVGFVVVRGFDASKYGNFTLSCKYDDPAPSTCKTPPLFDAHITWPGYTLGTWINDAPRTIGSNSCFVYKVDLVIGKEYDFKVGCGNGATADFDTFMEVWDSAGTGGIVNNDDGCEEWRSSVTWTASESVAYVVVKGFNSEKYGTYTLACMYDDGKKSAPLSINNNIQDAISIYPNPADQIIRINASAPFSFEGVSLSDFTGRVIRNWNLDSQENYLELQISDLNNGTYFLTVRTSDGLVRKKVVINR